MTTKSSIRIPKILRYLFLGLTAVGAVTLLLNLSGYFGITSDGPHIRGWVTSVADNQPVVVPHPDGSGDLKVFNMGQQRLIVIDFADMQAFMKARYLAYIFFQNLSWVLGIFVLYQMHRIFRNIDLGVMFRADNIRRIRLIAAAVLLFPIVMQIASRMIAGITYEAQGRQISMAAPPLFTEQVLLGGLLALVIMALAEIFRSGAELQQEQDLTI